MEIGIFKCPECGSKEFLYSERTGETVCPSCGLVLAEKNIVDPKKGSKPGVYKDSYGPGQAPWSHSQESGSIFGFSRGFRDINLNYLSPKDKAKFERLRRLHTSRGKDSIDPALTVFKNIINKVNTPWSVKVEALRIFLGALRGNLIAGRSYEAIIGTAIFIAYAKNNYPKSITEVAKRVSVPKEKIFRCYQLLVRKLKIQVKINLRPEDFVPQFCSEVHADMVIEQRARKILKDFQESYNAIRLSPIFIENSTPGIRAKQIFVFLFFLNKGSLYIYR